VSRSDELIRALGLQPHPEGGSFSEIFRSTALVSPADARGPRAALTTIYFLLIEGQRSRLHRVSSDEAWHFYEGDPLELLIVDRAFSTAERVILGPLNLRPFPEGTEVAKEGRRLAKGDGGCSRPVHVVPPGMWQAARPLGAYALVGCTVAPGFDFADFSLLDPKTQPLPIEDVRRLRSAWLRPFDRPEQLVYRGDDDPHALHVGVIQDDVVIGIASVAPGPRQGSAAPFVWQMRGVAAHPLVRGEGVGRILLTRCLQHVRAHQGIELWCNARATAVDFYRASGFETVGGPFEIPGTGPHFVMTRKP
jgi:uncharacterized protein